MRRALFTALMTSGALALGGAASEAADPVPAEAPETIVRATFEEDGFTVELNGDSEERELELLITRGRQFAVYSVPAQIDESSIKARFGDLGSIEMQFRTGARTADGCPASRGELPRTLTGSFDFAGERRYVEIERASLDATVDVFPSKACEERGPRRARASRSADHEDSVATLAARTPRHAKRFRFLFVVGIHESTKSETGAGGGLIERGSGMTVERGAQTSAGADAFRWSFERGTANVHLPAPFTGSATFRRRPGRVGRYRGSLQVPILGGDPIRLAGDAFKVVSLRPTNPFSG